MKIEQWKTEDIIPYENNPRINDLAVDKVAMSLEQYGWQQPIVVDKSGVVIAGHTRLKAAIKLCMETCPVVVAENLTKAQAKAYRIADNRTGEFAEWDNSLLDIEIHELIDMDFDIALTGFDLDVLNIETIERDGDEKSGSSPWDRVGDKNDDVIFSFGDITVNIPDKIYSEFRSRCPETGITEYVIKILKNEN